MSLLITGFGPFPGVADNPSGRLARELGGTVLETRYRFVDAWFAATARPDGLLMLGVDASATELRLETVARNWTGHTPDAEGIVAPGTIDPSAPPMLAATLWPAEALVRYTVSVDAGSYLCNYSFFRALRTWPDARIGFVHIPPSGVTSADIRELLELAGDID